MVKSHSIEKDSVLIDKLIQANGKIRKELIAMFFYIAIVVIISSTLFSLLIGRGISKPIQQLYSATRELEKGNFNARVRIKTNDELEELGKAFNLTAQALGQVDNERKQIDSTKTRFLSITSHELRSPMTPMRAQLQMLLGNYFGNLGFGSYR